MCLDIVILSKRLGAVGVIARSVNDAAVILEIIAGKCSEVEFSRTIPFSTVPNYTLSGFRGLQILYCGLVAERQLGDRLKGNAFYLESKPLVAASASLLKLMLLSLTAFSPSNTL